MHERFKVEEKEHGGIITPAVYERARDHRAYSDARRWKAAGFLKRSYESGDLAKDSEN